MADPRLVNNRNKSTQGGLEALGIYRGHVTAAGALQNGPSGWTVSGPTSSVFTVTHGLGLTANDYEVYIQVDGTSLGGGIVETKATNAFTVETSDFATPSVADRAFSFVMIVGDGE